jgi:hypothetical protein
MTPTSNATDRDATASGSTVRKDPSGALRAAEALMRIAIFAAELSLWMRMPVPCPSWLEAPAPHASDLSTSYGKT